MTSFMSKKKKYRFQVEICLEQLLEVPFVSAVLFAKLRLLDGGSFQDHSSRQEVRDHKVHWDAQFSFPCKMMANASTGVMEKCILRISIRKEYKGGRSFTKLGFVDLNLAEYAGAGLIHKKALLEGYDARHRQDNSMLKFRIQLNMISGDILFKAPSPSLKHKQTALDDPSADQRSDEFSSGSLAGSINSGSSGFGSLPKKRAPLPAELVIGQTLAETGLTSNTTQLEPPGQELAPTSVHVEVANDQQNVGTIQDTHGHSRNSSNTSQMSKASGYSSISHSRQSSSGDSAAGHIRNASQHDSLRRPVSQLHRTYTFPKHRLNIPTTIISESPGPPSAFNLNNSEGFHTPRGPDSAPVMSGEFEAFYTPQSELSTPETFPRQSKNHESVNHNVSDEVFKTPDGCFGTNVFDKNFNSLQKSASSGIVERMQNWPTKNGIPKAKEDVDVKGKVSYFDRNSDSTGNNNNYYIVKSSFEGVLRSKSDFTIPKLSPNPPRSERTLSSMIAAFWTPRLPRKSTIGAQSTPISNHNHPPLPDPLSKDDSRAASMGNLKLNNDGHLAIHGANFCRNPSSGSLQTNSDTGSLDRAKAAYERRKKNLNGPDEAGSGGVSGRVEITRVNPEDFIADLLKSTNLEHPDDSAETSGLQLFIAKDGTASLGGHEVKSQMSTGIKTFKQVVMDDR
ncbi:hypothetical protein ABEB36_005631 [Hypothenemus hampei]|uniref:C2 NT-type domain-containing protein n=1 Tax=Hypothenemus hampei TaxID=57062 RepID=A0ABD1F2S4_HYPHA